MDLTIIRAILLERGIAYAVTDSSLNILDLNGRTDLFYGESGQAESVSSLLDLVPELIGCEAVLNDILAGGTPYFELPLVNRTVADQTIYLMMLTLPHHDQSGQIVGLIHVMEDVTQLGMRNQQLEQQRNVLRLLLDKLGD